MGNKLGFVKEEPAAPDEPPKPAPTPAEIFNLKEQFLECWTVDDVVEWLKFHSYEEFSDIVKQLFIDGDALIHLAYFLSSNKASNENENSKEKSEEENAEDNNNNNNNTEQKKIKVERPTFPLSPQALKIIQQIEAVNNDKVAKLLETIREVVGKYEDQFGSQSTKGDDTFPPYDYPQFEDKENPANRKDIVMFYHHNTQHTQTGGSRSVERRWFSQPRIFRRYFGAPYSKLDIPINLSTSSPSPTLSTPYNNLYFPSPSLSLSSLPPSLSPPSLSSLSSPSALNSKSLSEFLFYSLSVSGRRDLWTLTSSPRSAWVKRVNPSSGGLHPIETYLILPPWIANTKEKEIDKEGGVYHYAVRHHALEKRCSISNSEFSKLDSLLNNGENFVIGVSSIHWREVWKYGERGFRYCMLDAGHALGSLAIAAARLGWKITLLPSIATDDVESILGLTESNQFISPVEKERGLILGIVNTSGKSVAPSHLPELQKILKNAKWEGVANHLSADHKEWDIVSKVDHLTKVDYIDQDSIMKVTEMPKEENSVANFSFLVKEDSKKGVTELGNLTESMSLENVIMSRRSALDYISKPISLEQFVHILYTLCQSDNILNIPWPATANIFFFAYHITDLHSGIYVLVLNPSELEKLKETTKDHDFAWTAPAGISSLPFYLLKEIPKEELSKTSYTSSCAQHIASQGAFSVGMFVDVEKVMESMGPSGYCRAHFECGALGQVLYLEAHALGLGATGMGCYLDDLARNTFGLQNSSYWPMYHFAIGVPSVDNRYTPYDYNDNMFEGVLDECVGILQPR